MGDVKVARTIFYMYIYTVYDWVIASTHYQAPHTQLSEE